MKNIIISSKTLKKKLSKNMIDITTLVEIT